MNNNYALDYYRMTGTKYKPGIKSWLKKSLSHNLQFSFWYRMYQQHPSLLAKIKLYRLSRIYGLEISPNAKIGKGLYLGHPYNITIGDGVIIGNNVNLHKGCTIGRTNRGNTGSPIIGNEAS